MPKFEASHELDMKRKRHADRGQRQEVRLLTWTMHLSRIPALSWSLKHSAAVLPRAASPLQDRTQGNLDGRHFRTLSWLLSTPVLFQEHGLFERFLSRPILAG